MAECDASDKAGIFGLLKYTTMQVKDIKVNMILVQALLYTTASVFTALTLANINPGFDDKYEVNRVTHSFLWSMNKWACYITHNSTMT